MIRLLLLDDGEVISAPLPEDTITDLAALAGRKLRGRGSASGFRHQAPSPAGER
jgi:hypothetical protein